MLNSLQKAITALQQKKMIILVDDEQRENEGDLVFAAEFTTPEHINFMVTHAKGLVCLTLEEKRAEELRLPLSHPFRPEYEQPDLKTAFTLSIEAKTGVTTGISAFDRAHTILTAINPLKGAQDLVSPGHVFPLKAQKEGVLKRAGHTEGSIDLMKLAQLQPSAVICEILKEDGSMARMDFLKEFAKKHDLVILSIKRIIQERMKATVFIEPISTTFLPTRFSDKPFQMMGFKNTLDNTEHVVLMHGEKQDQPLMRMHSECLTGDTFGSLRCDCGEQLQSAMQQIAEQGGILIYLRNHEGRGIGLGNKIKAYALQDQGRDTVDANKELGFQEDLRDYSVAIQILRYLQISSVRLLTNNPKKITALEEQGIRVLDQIALKVKPNLHNASYLKTKKERMGHHI
jgi:3,4-dihydroxy 2-butanone 4-phosphate synthase/GTP cyclohydrolase II